MSDFDDLYGVTQPPISDEQAERLLSGSSLEHDTASVAGLDAVFHSLRAPGTSAELSGMEAAVAAFQGGVVTPLAGATIARTRPMLKKRLTTKTIAAIGAVTLISAGAAAASGTIPSPFASDRAKEATSEHVPDNARDNVAKHLEDDETTTTTAESTTTSTEETTTTTTEATTTTESTVAPESTEADDANGVGPDANGPAKFGLCTAFAAHHKHDDSSTSSTDAASTPDVPVAFRNLADAAAAAGQTVEEFCADATPGGKSAPAPEQGAESSSATAPGHSGDNPSNTAPGKSEHGPASKPSGRSDHGPATTVSGS